MQRKGKLMEGEKNNDISCKICHFLFKSIKAPNKNENDPFGKVGVGVGWLRF